MNKVILALNTIIGSSDEPVIADQLEILRKSDSIDYISLSSADTSRRRLRVKTSMGKNCTIALPRNAELSDGKVLFLDANCAIVVRIKKLQWLKLRAKDQMSALELGYHCGNLHWKVKFHSGDIWVAIEGDETNYLSRLTQFMESGRVFKI